MNLFLGKIDMSAWVLVTLTFVQMLATVGVIIWRVSALLERRAQTAAAALAAHTLDDQRSFAGLTTQLSVTSDKLREELANIATSLRAMVMATQAELNEKINRVELESSRQFLSKDAFYAAFSEMRNQNKDDFKEVKDALIRLEAKIESK